MVVISQLFVLLYTSTDITNNTITYAGNPVACEKVERGGGGCRGLVYPAIVQYGNGINTNLCPESQVCLNNQADVNFI